MVEVAYVAGNGTDLEFLEVNFSIWPSKGMIIMHVKLSYNVIINQAIFLMMESLSLSHPQ